MKNIGYFFENLFDHFGNLITWFPVIWNDKQWDSDYFIKILNKKLKRMEKFYRSKHASHLYAYNDADNIHKCFLVTQRILENNYLTEALKPFEEKFPDYNWNRDFEETGEGTLRLVSHDTEEEKELHHKCYMNAEKMREDDYDELFASMRLHIEDWWD